MKGKGRATEEDYDEQLWSMAAQAPSSSSLSLPKRRGSLMAVATDALSGASSRLGINRRTKRQSVHRVIAPIFFPDVIEIKPQPPRLEDDEVEERERLRDAAAASIGIDPGLMNGGGESGEMLCVEEENEDDEEGYEKLDLHDPDISPQESTFSRIKGIHSRSNSVTYSTAPATPAIPPPPIPSFPSSVSKLEPYTQVTSSLPKFCPPHTSLRLFQVSLTKQWKNRWIVLSSPLHYAPLPANSKADKKVYAPSPSYLHLFKSSSPDSLELERLEINEDSVVFVAEGELSGRKGVVKVGGVEASFKGGSTKPKMSFNGTGNNVEEGGRTMWLLQITDSAESQKWIGGIKNAILGQRSLRAGLPPPLATQPTDTHEPRGDMDVMLYMRAQGIVTSPTTPSHSRFGSTSTNFKSSTPSSGYSAFGNHARATSAGASTVDRATSSASMSSRSSRAHSLSTGSGAANGHINGHASVNGSPALNGASPKPSVTVSALKGLFTGGRPKSPSVVSLGSERESSHKRSSVHEDLMNGSNRDVVALSPRARGSSLLKNMLRTSAGAASMEFSNSSSTDKTPPLSPSTTPSASRPSFTPNSPITSHPYGPMSPSVTDDILGQVSPLERKIVPAEFGGWSADAIGIALPGPGDTLPKDRRIFNGDGDRTPNHTSNGRSMSTASATSITSLQPAPRRRWDSTGPRSPMSPRFIQESNNSSGADESSSGGEFGDIVSGDAVLEGFSRDTTVKPRQYTSITPSDSPVTPPLPSSNTFMPSSHSPAKAPVLPSSPAYSGFSFGSPPQTPRPTSLRSVSTFASATHSTEGGSALDHGQSNASLKNKTSFGTTGSASGKAKRWSRQIQNGTLPKRQTPPSGPPPTPPQNAGTPLPSSSTPSHKRTRSLQSQSTAQSSHSIPRPVSGASAHSSKSQNSIVSGLPVFKKRASGSSVVSAATGGSSSSISINGSNTQLPPQPTLSRQTSFGSRSGASHRASMPPPARPPPTSALPPPPASDDAHDHVQSPERQAQKFQPPIVLSPLEIATPTPPISRSSSLRESITHRSFRLSVNAPKPPPSSGLPLRPDDQEQPIQPQAYSSSRDHPRGPRKNSSSSSKDYRDLYPIPASPPTQVAPLPPPSGPLPPIPATNSANVSNSLSSSLSRRFRNLSTPNANSITNTSLPAVQTSPNNTGFFRARSSTLNTAFPTTYVTHATHVHRASPDPPSTPIGEKITTFQNDPSFLDMFPSPVLSSPEPPRKLSRTPDGFPMTSLSPPPRRGSRQLEREVETEYPTMEPEEGSQFLTLSHRGSVVSLGRGSPNPNV